MKEPIRTTQQNKFRTARCRLVFVLGLLWLTMTSGPVTWAQSPPASLTPSARDDRSLLPVRQPKATHLRELQTDRAYQYGRDTPPPENPIARFFTWLFRKLGAFLSSKAYENIWQYVILAAVAALAIYLLAKAEVLGFLFPQKTTSSEMDYENLTEDIQAIDFDTAIEEAVAGRNFRLAVRLLYLQTLKHLTNTGQIEYRPGKTNRQYVQELAGSAMQADFEKVTRQFEFVWYGDFPVDDQQFVAIRNEFRQVGVGADSMGKPQQYSRQP